MSRTGRGTRVKKRFVGVTCTEDNRVYTDGADRSLRGTRVAARFYGVTYDCIGTVVGAQKGTITV